MLGYISNIQKFSVNDGYGIRSVVFLLGCTLNCKWCQNPETIGFIQDIMYIQNLCNGCGACKKACPHSAKMIEKGEALFIDRDVCEKCFKCTKVCNFGARKVSGRKMMVEDVLDAVLKDKAFYDSSGGGVTLSGGEPFVQHEFCFELLKKCKEHGVNTCIETAGYVPWEVIERCVPLIDLFLYDIKLLDCEKHEKWTGKSNDLVLDNLDKIAKTEKEIIIRIPLIPNVNDGEEFENIINYLTKYKNIKEIHILPFHHIGSSKYEQLGLDYELEKFDEENDETAEICGDYARKKGYLVSIGGSGFNSAKK